MKCPLKMEHARQKKIETIHIGIDITWAWEEVHPSCLRIVGENDAIEDAPMSQQKNITVLAGVSDAEKLFVWAYNAQIFQSERTLSHFTVLKSVSSDPRSACSFASRIVLSSSSRNLACSGKSGTVKKAMIEKQIVRRPSRTNILPSLAKFCCVSNRVAYHCQPASPCLPDILWIKKARNFLDMSMGSSPVTPDDCLDLPHWKHSPQARSLRKLRIWMETHSLYNIEQWAKQLRAWDQLQALP